MKRKEIGIFEAKTRLSELVQEVSTGGAQYCITKRGRPVAELRAPTATGRKRLSFGYGKNGTNRMAADFDAPLEDFDEYQ